MNRPLTPAERSAALYARRKQAKQEADNLRAQLQAVTAERDELAKRLGLYVVKFGALG